MPRALSWSPRLLCSKASIWCLLCFSRYGMQSPTSQAQSEATRIGNSSGFSSAYSFTKAVSISYHSQNNRECCLLVSTKFWLCIPDMGSIPFYQFQSIPFGQFQFHFFTYSFYLLLFTMSRHSEHLFRVPIWNTYTK